MTHDQLMQLEDAASAAMAIRGDWERAYRMSRSEFNKREFIIADAIATRALARVEDARRLLAATERAAAEAAKVRRASAQPSLFN